MVRKKGKSYYCEFMISGQRYNAVCKGCTTKTEAERFEKERRRIVEKAVAQKSAAAFLENFKDELTGGKPILLAEAFDLYLQKPARREAKPEQIRKNRTYWNDFLAFMSSKHPSIERLSQVTRQQAEAYVMYLRQHGPFNRVITATSSTGKVSTYKTQAEKFSHRTINGRHKAVKAVFYRLAEDAGLLSNPFDIPVLKNDTVNRDIFTPEEIELIGNHMTMPITKPVFTIGFSTGLTLGDICLLKWEEISENWITNKNRRKTGSELQIPILPPLAVFLKEQRRQGIDKCSEYVCPELAKMYMTNQSGVQYRIKKFLSKLGITTTKQQEGKRAVSVKAAHAMRHTFAYFASINHIPLNIVQSILGHMSSEMTATYQKHVRQQEVEKLFNQMPNFLLGQSELTPSLSANEESERKKLKQLAETAPIKDVRSLLEYSSTFHRIEDAVLVKDEPAGLICSSSSSVSADFGQEEKAEDPVDLFQWAETTHYLSSSAG